MSGETDRLIGLAKQIQDRPVPRELDVLLSTGEQVTIALLAMAIHAEGYEAVSMTGAQAGIVSDSSHTKARIESVNAERVAAELAEGRIVIVAGFQGLTTQGEITTLGRGGSDTTAVAVAAGLGADVCEIYTDVDGVYTADPRIVPEACKISRISYEEMLELAGAGARVLQLRAVEFARNHGVAIHVRSSFNDNDGTIVKEADPTMEAAIISGVAHDTSEAKVTIRDVPDHPGVAAEVFGHLAEANVNVDMIIQNVSEAGMTDISFTVPKDDLVRAKRAVSDVCEELGAREWSVDESIAKISLVGAGMKTHPGISAKMFSTLADAGVNIDLISTSPIRISCVISAAQVGVAVRALHEAFELSADAVTAEASSTSGGAS
jgi:aspartate kinase